MSKRTTSTTEEFIESIYRLEKRSGIAKTTELAKMLNVVSGTVTNTIERLEKEEYLIHEPYKGVKLTEKGKQTALLVIKKHRLAERLLHDLLQMKWDVIHDVACKLEHGITQNMIAPLEKVLNNPRTCPHGNPIPQKSGENFEEKSNPLIGLKLGAQGRIVKIIEENGELLRYLSELGLIPGELVKVLEKAPFNGPISLKIKGKRRSISPSIAEIIFVKQIN